MAKKTKLEIGNAVQTNAKFQSMFPKMGTWTGRLLRQHATIEGAWYIELDVPKGLPVQVINAKFLEHA